MPTSTVRAAEPPPWADALRPGRWFRVSGDAPDLGLPATAPGTRYLGDNDPATDPALNPPRGLTERARRLAGRRWRAPWSGRCGFPAMTEAWNGAVYASGCGPSGAMLVFGGGHDDYYGSDVHAFDLARREWRRVADGYTAGAAGDYGPGAVYPDSVYPDGSPLPPHTCGYVQYDAAGNNYVLLKGQTELGPDVRAAPIPHLFNLDTHDWQHGPRHPLAVLNSGGFSCADGRRGVVWGHAGDDGGGNALVAYRPSGHNADGSVGAWTHFSANKLPGEANYNAMVLHPGLDRIVIAAHRRDTLLLLDPERPAEPLRAWRSAGSRPPIRKFASLEFSRSLNSIVSFSAADGPAIYAAAGEPAARWRALTDPHSLDPVADAAAATGFAVNRDHTFGRFRIAQFDSFDLAVLVRHVDTPVYCMRLP